MMDDVVGLARAQRHVQRRQHEIGRHRLAECPADDAPAPDVEHDGQVDEAGPGRDVGHVGHPQLVRAVGA